MHEARSDIVLIQESGALCQEWTSDSTACVVFGGCVYNAPAIILSNTAAKFCSWNRSDVNYSALGLTMHGVSTVLLSIYLPDSGKSDSLFEAAITTIDNSLDEIWSSQPWQCLIMGGDANVHVLPVDDVIGPACDGSAWNHRSMLLYQLAAK